MGTGRADVVVLLSFLVFVLLAMFLRLAMFAIGWVCVCNGICADIVIFPAPGT